MSTARKIIQIDEALCNGCGLCAGACHEGAIAMVNGKAKLVREDHCDGLGDCLPACPVGAITFVTRPAPAYDPAAVARTRAAQAAHAGGCPGSRPQVLSQPVGAIDVYKRVPFSPSQQPQKYPPRVQLAIIFLQLIKQLLFGRAGAVDKIGGFQPRQGWRTVTDQHLF